MQSQGWFTRWIVAGAMCIATVANGQEAGTPRSAWSFETEEETTRAEAAATTAFDRAYPETATQPTATKGNLPLPVPPPDVSTVRFPNIQATRAHQTPAPAAPTVVPAPTPPGRSAPANAAPAAGGFDRALVSRGSAAFQAACTQCHDAERSTSKVKDLAGWRATVRRMAGKNGADVPQSDWEAIATYLASLRAPAGGSAGGGAAPAAGGFDRALVSRGSAAFQSACTQCHDAERATTKVKDLAGWRATVQRMAGKSGANVPQGDWEAIATYLASLSAPAGGSAGGGAAAAGSAQQVSWWATFSPLWREGNDHVEDQGFFPLTWLGANWQGPGPLSARVTACTTCHTEPGNGHRIELVEAALRVDLVNLICHRDSPIKAVVDAGRFIVPFGAFSAQVNPGVYRTVSTPLIFNMGQRVFASDIGDPVLPLPYANQGANLSLAAPIHENLTATLDAYVINGLRGNANGIDFYDSRNWVGGNVDNKEPNVGTRVTLGNQFVRLGASLTGGRFNSDSGSGPRNQGLYYRIYGFDLTARYENLLRFQIEYADRDTDRVTSLAGQPVVREHVGGMYMEGEVRFKKKSKWSFLMRYDLLDHRSVVPVPGSTIPTGSFDVKRTTGGVNYQLTGNSLLMVNYERWILPSPLPNLNVYGVRWAATF